MGKKTGSPRLFTGISWGVTILIVAGLLGFGFWRVFPSLSVSAAAQSARQATPTGRSALAAFSTEIAPANANANLDAIVRKVWLKTSITSKTTYTVTDYTVQPGDALFSIAAQFNIKPETLLWSNNAILQGSPDSLRVGQVLKVPPVDGVYYQVQTGDTLASIANKFSAKLDGILNWPGNNIDLTTQQVTSGMNSGNGISGTAAGSITLTCGTMYSNVGLGLDLTSPSAITLMGIFSGKNGGADSFSIPPVITQACPLP